MNRIFVKPASPDVTVRKPVNGPLAAEGEWVNEESYWLRRITDGDVVVDTTAPAESGAAGPLPSAEGTELKTKPKAQQEAKPAASTATTTD